MLYAHKPCSPHLSELDIEWLWGVQPPNHWSVMVQKSEIMLTGSPHWKGPSWLPQADCPSQDEQERNRKLRRWGVGEGGVSKFAKRVRPGCRVGRCSNSPSPPPSSPWPKQGAKFRQPPPNYFGKVGIHVCVHPAAAMF